MQKITLPSKTLAQGFEYTPSNHTNIQCTWRKFGWKPLQELAIEEPPKSTYFWGRETLEKGASNA
jgi:hypothetical protein